MSMLMSVVTRFDAPMITYGDGLQGHAVEWKRRPVMLSGGLKCLRTVQNGGSSGLAERNRSGWTKSGATRCSRVCSR